MYEPRFSDNNAESKRDVPSFIEPRPPLILNPFMRPKPQKGTNLLELFEEDSECEEPELVQVYLRLKPCSVQSNLYEVRSDRCLITSLDTTTAGHGRRTQHNVSKMYTFSHIFGPEVNQKEIFENVVKDNLKKLPDGHSFTLLTYGASGSGKTYTLMGTVASPGLVPRSLEYVFRVVDAAQQPLYKPSEGGADKLSYAEQDYELQWVKRLRQVSAPLRDKYRRMSARLCSDMAISTMDLSKRTRHYVWVSFVEIYNEGIYDLLAPGDRRNAPKLLIREDSNGTVYVKGATQAFVRTGEEAYDVMVAGKHNLQVAATGVHAQSSRSHCIFTITMLTHTDDGVRISCVRLCDLAGCERARRTRNTGARMQESRAINSSLHVLERCLHTLRRKQKMSRHALVPYRESKLTRLLGAGLSGARGEAVSMVVTLNPAPEYAHETRHVLQLAAVARDIQINNTMSDYPSTLETTQDTTLGSSSDILKLRCENERLHFELIQAQARNKELTACMEERQAETADKMRELVREAQQISQQYYESQLTALREEMEEMADEYEEKLSKAAAPPAADTPSRSMMQNKITQLMTDIAILEEKLSAERLARARAEEEVQYLRACIDERDEKSLEHNAANNNEEVMRLTDSEDEAGSDAEEDPLNESLEPTFTREDLNRSRLVRQSLLMEPQSSHDDSLKCDEKSDDSLIDKSTDTIKENEKTVGSLDETYATGNESELSKKADVTTTCDSKCLSVTHDDDVLVLKDKTNENDESSYFEDGIEMSIGSKIKEVALKNKNKYFEPELEMTSNVNLNETDIKPVCRGTYFVLEPKTIKECVNAPVDGKFKSTEMNKTRATIDNNISNNTNFESVLQDTSPIGCNSGRTVASKGSSDNNETIPIESNSGKNVASKGSCDDIAKIDIHNKEEVDAVTKMTTSHKAPEKFINKIINSLKTSKNSNSSLAQFEQLEKAARDCKSECNLESLDEFGNIKKLKEKRMYFDDVTKEYQTELAKSGESKTYFDNISANIDKVVDRKMTEVGNEIRHDDLRSPSIVKDDIINDCEPSTMKILLGESITRLPEPSTVIKNKKVLMKKSESIDVFDSPQATIEATIQLEDLKKIRNSIKAIRLDDNVETTNILPVTNVEQPSLSDDINKDDVLKNAVDEVIVFKSPKRQNFMPDNTDSSSLSTCKSDNTMEEFENIYKAITAPRATEFDLLVSQDCTETQINETAAQEMCSTEEKKIYNLRQKHSSKLEKTNVDEEVLLESHCNLAKSKPQATKRNLRLRRRKNMAVDDWKDEEKEIDRCHQLKDIVNLQNEFSDVTIDVPAPPKDTKDIPSPEKLETEAENVAPIAGVQSCPSKSVTRSRRKLFTPRAEPLEESMQGESGERVYVPRPSYHRPRARRKL